MLANGLARGNWPGATKAMARTPRTQEAKAVSSSYDCVRFVPSPTQSGSRSYCLDERGWWYPEDAGAGKECDTGAELRRPPRPRIKHSSTESSPVALSATRKTLSTFGRGRFSPSSRKLFEGEAAIPCDRTGRLRRHHDPVTSQQQQQQQQHRQQRHEGKTRQTMHVGMGHGQENIRICPKHMPMRPRIRKAYADSGPPVGQRDPALSTAAARKADGRKRRAPTFCHDRRQPGFGSAGPPSCVMEQTTNPLDNSDPQVASLSVFDSRIRATDSGNRPVYAAEIRAVPGPRRCRFLGAMIRKQKSCPHRASRISQSRITVVRRPGITPPPLAGSPRGLVSSCAQDAFRLSAAVNSFPVS
ncbi:hypothetical protein AXG93_4193s1070 [Marchantia polymorpha subsp. ruderalis]|uniref:Uncharacterized protein n=1 Tax=Marchantia polymorpha subsp. ruderalis TaxID=1480154 RepID=A0A176W3V4_MARPO|nr:hypothetical protein AXG93_4193s1070 [Marchantia polymorpha subsp. ruderalis]